MTVFFWKRWWLQRRFIYGCEDLYGKSKIVGEIAGKNKMLIRSSIIGPEEGNGYS